MRLDQIKADCKRKMQHAMKNTANEAERILGDSFDQFYNGGTPKYYKRTYTLPNASEIIGPNDFGNAMTLEAGYYGERLHYEHPPGSYDGPKVLEATTTGTSGVVGDPTFDEVALDKIKQAASDNFNKFFHK